MRKEKDVSMNNNEMHEAKKLRRKFFRLTNRYTRIGNRYDAIEEYIYLLNYDIETIKDIKNAKLDPITPHLVLEICRDQRMNLYGYYGSDIDLTLSLSQENREIQKWLNKKIETAPIVDFFLGDLLRIYDNEIEFENKLLAKLKVKVDKLNSELKDIALRIKKIEGAE